MPQSLLDFCNLHNRPELLKEWDREKNGELTPDTAYPYSRARVCWRCEKGHSWFASIRSRVEGMTGCPVCAGKAVQAGENDLATLYPEIAAQWHPTKNGQLLPSMVCPRTHRKVWWRCELGHEWRAEIAPRVNGAGCPYCSGRVVLPGETDLATLYPELVQQWHPTKNGQLLPSMVRPGTRRKVWWRCELGHEWQAEIKHRVNGVGCPYCSGHVVLPGETDLATLYPELAQQWHPAKNGALTPRDVRPGTQKKVWWQCERGHEWQAAISSRVGGSGCPICGGKTVVAGINDLASQYPDLAKQWHPIKNGALKPTMVTSGSNKKVWWRCEHGHEWMAIVASRARKGHGCPVCANKKLLTGFNDLQTRYPEIAKEWISEKNGTTPDKVLPAERKVWWRCPNGHEYQCQINTRAYQGVGCPVCAGKSVAVGENDLATLYPQLAKQWHPTKNGALKPTMVTDGSNQKVWWRCELGHEWMAKVIYRAHKGNGCPVCAGKVVLVGFNDLASQEPEIAAQWHPTLNAPRTPEMYTCGSGQRIWWQCSDGHVWQAPINRRCYYRTDCPVCSGSVSKKKLAKYERMMIEALAEQERKKYLEERNEFT